MIKTEYGNKKSGSTRFIIVATHAAGDDFRTGAITSRLAKALGGFCVKNKKYIKPNNSHSFLKPESVEDFNILKWSNRSNRYLWKRRKSVMKQFYQDVSNFCDQARKYTSAKPVVIYIHGFSSQKVGIDVGAGARNHNNGRKLFGSKKHREVGDNTGEITINISTLKKIHKQLQKKLKILYNLDATVGQVYSGWSKQSGIQFHRHWPQDEYAIQFEINRELREKKNTQQLVNLLAEILTQAFPK